MSDHLRAAIRDGKMLSAARRARREGTTVIMCGVKDQDQVGQMDSWIRKELAREGS